MEPIEYWALFAVGSGVFVLAAELRLGRQSVYAAHFDYAEGQAAFGYMSKIGRYLFYITPLLLLAGMSLLFKLLKPDAWTELWEYVTLRQGISPGAGISAAELQPMSAAMVDEKFGLAYLFRHPDSGLVVVGVVLLVVFVALFPPKHWR